jgi:Glycosyl hydrolases family 39
MKLEFARLADAKWGDDHMYEHRIGVGRVVAGQFLTQGRAGVCSAPNQCRKPNAQFRLSSFLQPHHFHRESYFISNRLSRTEVIEGRFCGSAEAKRAMKAVGIAARIIAAICICPIYIAFAAPTNQVKPFEITVDWSKSTGRLRTIPTLQVVVNPMLRAGSQLHDAAFGALKYLNADYVRFVPWYPYPRLAVAELEPPHDGKTSWDFSLIDPLMLDFFEATKGHPAILNFSTQPAWMFKTDRPVSYPSNPDQVTWTYSGYSGPPDKGLVDATGRQLAEYYSRIVSWYTNGGFTDESGRFHKSGFHFDIPYWEVFNEPDGFEHNPTPEQYTRWYDAIVTAIRKVSPKTKFVGLALSGYTDAKWFEYFLNPRNHQPGIPLDMISYHVYSIPGPTESIDQWQYSFFSQADDFISAVRFIELIRKRLSPSTQTTIDEAGTSLLDDGMSATPKPIPAAYWNVSGATYAYLFMKLSELGIETLNESALIQYPSQFPDATMIDWVSGRPNARYWVLKLLKDRFNRQDELCATTVHQKSRPTVTEPQGMYPIPVAAQAFRSPVGERKILVVNKANSGVRVSLRHEAMSGQLEVVDQKTGEGPARVSALDSQMITMAPFAVAVVTLH